MPRNRQNTLKRQEVWMNLTQTLETGLIEHGYELLSWGVTNGQFFYKVRPSNGLDLYIYPDKNSLVYANGAEYSINVLPQMTEVEFINAIKSSRIILNGDRMPDPGPALVEWLVKAIEHSEEDHLGTYYGCAKAALEKCKDAINIPEAHDSYAWGEFFHDHQLSENEAFIESAVALVLDLYNHHPSKVIRELACQAEEEAFIYELAEQAGLKTSDDAEDYVRDLADKISEAKAVMEDWFCDLTNAVDEAVEAVS